VLGLDIGGANLKAAHTAGQARTVPFALWKDPTRLPGELLRFAADWPAYETLAVTMTGELCDCYPTKRAGVAAILDAVEAASPTPDVLVWTLDRIFIPLARARSRPVDVAAANWLALATYAGRYAQEASALLIDIGSTTTDIVSLIDGCPAPKGRTDPERLASSELVYTGARRTPIAALLGGEVAAELFATTLDVYLLLGPLSDNARDTDTADGRAATRDLAHARMARMLCGDAETCSLHQTMDVAHKAREAQRELICRAIDTVARRAASLPAAVVLSGSGGFIARDIISHCQSTFGARAVDLGEMLGMELSTAACAYAVAVLASAEAEHGI
jgi:probable H4MPT-linked C1 transfer pathway protein